VFFAGVYFSSFMTSDIFHSSVFNVILLSRVTSCYSVFTCLMFTTLVL
jgi:hypothetical protein